MRVSALAIMGCCIMACSKPAPKSKPTEVVVDWDKELSWNPAFEATRSNILRNSSWGRILSGRTRNISIQGFFMDETEITSNEYREFVEWSAEQEK